MTRPVRAAGLLAALYLLGACPTRFDRARPDQPLAPDEVLLVGEAVFVPADWQSSLDVGQVWLGFTWGADTPVAPDRAHDEDVVLPVKSGEPFAVVGPRRDAFLRSVTVAWRRQDTSGGYLEVARRYTKCLGRWPLHVQAGDEVLYLGRIVCRYTRPDELVVEDAWAETAPRLQEVVAGRSVRHLVGGEAATTAPR